MEDTNMGNSKKNTSNIEAVSGPEKTIPAPLAQVRLSMHSRTRSDRATIESLMKETGMGILTRPVGQKGESKAGIIYERTATDAIKMGLAHALKGKLKGFAQDGKSYRLLTVACKTVAAGDLAIDIDLQERANESSYGKVGRITYLAGSSSVGFEKGEAFDRIPGEMANVLLSPGDLLTLGRQSLFDTDLRKISEYLLASARCQKIWPGTYLVSSAEQLEKATLIKNVLGQTVEGKFTLGIVHWATDAANKAALSEEIENEYIDRLEGMAQSLSGAVTEANYKRIKGDCEDLMTAQSELEKTLEREFSAPYWEAANVVLQRLEELTQVFESEKSAKSGGKPKTKADLEAEIERMRAQLAALSTPTEA